MASEVITTTDKAKRDALFDDLRKNGNRQERQVVKFSSNEVHAGQYVAGRLVYRSTWSVAYPDGNGKPKHKPSKREARRAKSN